MSSSQKSPRAAACRYAYRKFRDLKDVKPTVRKAGPHRVFTFKKDIGGKGGGPKLKKIVKITVSNEGKIVKVVASR